MWNSNPDASISVIATGVLLYAFRRNRRVQAGAFVAGTMVLIESVGPDRKKAA